MYVVSVPHVLRMTELLHHQALLASGACKIHRRGTTAIFVSHQWLGLMHPDEHMKQFAILQKALWNLIAGSIDVAVCFVTASLGRLASVLDRERSRKLAEAFIWYDWFSVPQLEPRAEDMTIWQETQDAVDSIPAYVSACQYFFVLVPSLPHTNHADVICDKSTWNQRGWCRTEAWIADLCPRDLQKSCVSIYEEKLLIEFMPLQWLFTHPKAGKFTREVDRQLALGVSRQVLQSRVEVTSKSSESVEKFKGRFLRAMMGHLDPDYPSPDNLSSWLKELGFGSIDDQALPEGWGPMSMAALQGNLQMVRELADRGLSVNAPTKASEYSVMAEEGMTPLMIASMYISDGPARMETCALLLGLRADFSARDAKGNTALHRAAWSSVGSSTCQLLLDHKADVNCRNKAGESPLWTACFRNPTTSEDPSACLEVLLNRGADVNALTVMGWAPIHILVVLGGPEDVDLMLKAGVDINQPTMATDALAAQAAQVEEGWKSEAVCKLVMDTFCHLSPGSTPLMWSCLLSNAAVGLRLLDLKADHTIRSSTGISALDFARLRGISGPLVRRLEEI